MKPLMLISGSLLLIFILILFIGVIIELKQDDMLFQKYNRLKHHPNKIRDLYECQGCGARFNSKLSTCPICSQPLIYNSSVT
jgi:rRNA maturation endonuclease Nob1